MYLFIIIIEVSEVYCKPSTMMGKYQKRLIYAVFSLKWTCRSSVKLDAEIGCFLVWVNSRNGMDLVHNNFRIDPYFLLILSRFVWANSQNGMDLVHNIF